MHGAFFVGEDREWLECLRLGLRRPGMWVLRWPDSREAPERSQTEPFFVNRVPGH